ncbi:hypothetical protein AYI69_g3218 [Smittium culicis]|uniref:Uncharacterized protein n=1 Tax=Smittium culicis TaxID=133412 RepID=A0A1R1YKB8_9FUNG|nr:hypothetical protein AYI69_g3218 [Smittium culicis]
MSGELHRKSSSDFDYPDTRMPYAPPNSGAIEALPVDDEIMDDDGHFDKICHSDPIVLEEQADGMKQALILSQDIRIGSFHRFQRHSTGKSGGTSHVFGVMESRRGKEAYKSQKTAHNLYALRLRNVVGRSVLLFSDKNTTLAYEGRGLIQLVPRYEDIRPERTELKLVRIQQPLLLPTVEPNLSSSTEGQTRTSNNDSGNANVKVRYLVLRPHGHVNLKPTPPTRKDDHNRSKKRKFYGLDKQSLELDIITISGVNSKPKVSKITPLNVSFQTNDESGVDPDTALSNSNFWTDESQTR